MQPGIFKVNKIAAGGMFHIQDEMECAEYPLASFIGASYLLATHEQIKDIRDRMLDRLECRDFEMEIEGASMKDLTDAQVAFGVKAAKRSLLAVLVRLNKALPGGRN